MVEHARVARKSVVHRALAASAKALPAVALVCTLRLVVLTHVRLGDLADLVSVHIIALITGTTARTSHQIPLQTRILARSLLLKSVADTSCSIALQRNHTGTCMKSTRWAICLLTTTPTVCIGSSDLFQTFPGATGHLRQQTAPNLFTTALRYSAGSYGILPVLMAGS